MSKGKRHTPEQIASILKQHESGLSAAVIVMKQSPASRPPCPAHRAATYLRAAIRAFAIPNRPRSWVGALLTAGFAVIGTALAVEFPEEVRIEDLDGDVGFSTVPRSISGTPDFGAAGDVSGDGLDDFIVGSPWREAYIVFGTDSAPFPAQLDLAELDPSRGMVILRAQEGETLESVSAAGDFNADGFGDVLLGDWKADPAGRADAGQSYVVFGAVNLGAAGPLDLSTLIGANGFVLNGVQAKDQSGYSVSLAGDVNGDGFDDLVVSAWSLADTRGAAYVVFGGSGTDFDGSLELDKLDGIRGFVVYGQMEGDRLGRVVSNAGDVNGDGIDDLLLLAGVAAEIPGAAYVLFGNPDIGGDGVVELGGQLDGEKGFVVEPPLGNYWHSSHASGAGDINGDGFSDMIFSSDAEQDGQPDNYVLLGAADVGLSGSVTLKLLDGSDGFAIDNGPEGVIHAATAGDVNDDGFDDLIMAQDSEVHIVFGSSDLGSDGLVVFSELAGGGVTIRRESGKFGALWAGSAGDINGDGIDDALMGARTGGFGARNGAAYVLFGVDPGPELSVSPLDFGDVAVGEFAEQNVVVTSTGMQPLLVGSVAEKDMLDAPFEIVADDCSNQVIDPAEQCTITVRFTPDQIAVYADSFDLPSNGTFEASVPVAVSGKGIGETRCDIFLSSDVPKTIDAVGTPVVTSTLDVQPGGVINDVDVLELRGTHSSLGDLEFSLESPGGTRVTLMERACSDEDDFDLSLDDDATEIWPCPPIDQGTYLPSNPLSEFQLDDSGGSWTLTVDDDANLDGGALDGWGLRICAEFLPNSAPVAGDLELETAADTVLERVLPGSDPDGDVLVFSIIENGTLGSATITDERTGAFRYVPDTDLGGEDLFVYMVEDPHGASDLGNVSVTVSPPPPPTPPPPDPPPSDNNGGGGGVAGWLLPLLGLGVFGRLLRKSRQRSGRGPKIGV